MLKALSVIVASVAMFSTASASGFYVGTFGGPNCGTVDEHLGWLDTESGEGYVIGGVAGTKIDGVPGLRIEAEVSYRSNDLDTVAFAWPLVVTDETVAVMANAVYDLPFAVGGLHPYVMAGAGVADRTISIDYLPVFEINNTGFAWQVGAGVNTQIATGVVFGVGYRLLDAPDADLPIIGGAHDAGLNHSVIASISFPL